MYVQRNQSAKFRQLVEHFPVVVVCGARQVGKSTLIGHELGESFRTVVFDPVVDVGNARGDPELFLSNHPPPLVLDEIQYAPELLPVLKRRIDMDRKPGQYVLTGSQQWGVLKNLAESLAGRVVFLDLHGFAANEAQRLPLGSNWLEAWLANAAAFPFAQARPADPAPPLYDQLWRGSLPDACLLPAEVVPDFLAAYRRTYVERDVRLLSGVEDLHLFGRFFALAGALSGQEVNHSHLGRELGVAPQTARRWMGLLKDSYQWLELPAFSRNAVKRLSDKPKGYLTDTGLVCAAQSISSPAALSGHPLCGALFETAAVNELRKLAALLPMPPSFHHWRTHGGAEVDVVLERDGTFFPIEIKLRSRPARRDCSGLRAFRATYPDLRVAPGLVLAPMECGAQIGPSEYAIPWNCTLPGLPPAALGNPG
jgi:uncharacterized protein